MQKDIKDYVYVHILQSQSHAIDVRALLVSTLHQMLVTTRDTRQQHTNQTKVATPAIARQRCFQVLAERRQLVRLASTKPTTKLCSWLPSCNTFHACIQSAASKENEDKHAALSTDRSAATPRVQLQRSARCARRPRSNARGQELSKERQDRLNHALWP